MTDEKKPAEPKATKPTKTTKETIYVDIEDDITSIISKMEAAKSTLVALVLPKRSTTLQSIVNMRLLKRSADKDDNKVVVITTEAALLPLAGAGGLNGAKNLQSVPEIPDGPEALPATPEKLTDPDDELDEKAKIDYKKPVGALAAASVIAHDDEDGEAIALEDKAEESKPGPSPKKSAPKNSKLKIPNFDLFRTRMGKVILAIVALFLFFIIGGKVLPKATINLQTTSDPVSASVNLTTSDKAKKLDLKSNTIPAELKTTNQSATQQVTATGQKNLGKKATGSVTMSAGACSGNIPANVPAGSAISQNSLTYITQSSASFSPVVSNGHCSFQSNNISINAQNAGASYNVSSATFSVSGRSDVSASGSASGGTDNTVTVLSQSDVDAAVKKVTANGGKELTDKYKKELEDAGYYVLDSTLKTGKAVINATPAIGQQTSSSSVSIKVPYTVLVVKEDHLKAAITDALNKQIDTAHQKLSTDDVLKDADVSVQSQSSPTVVSLSVTERTTAVPLLDQDAIKKEVAGKKSGDIKELLGNLPGVKAVNVSFSPFWVSKAPSNPKKVIIVTQEITSTDKNTNQTDSNQSSSSSEQQP